jgi:hypothetical protein
VIESSVKLEVAWKLWAISRSVELTVLYHEIVVLVDVATLLKTTSEGRDVLVVTTTAAGAVVTVRSVADRRRRRWGIFMREMRYV